jgi:hypothetical protein
MLFHVTINGLPILDMPLEHKTLAVALMAYAEAVLAGRDAHHVGIALDMVHNQHLPGIKEKLDSGEITIQPLNYEGVLAQMREFVALAFPELDIAVNFRPLNPPKTD